MSDAGHSHVLESNESGALTGLLQQAHATSAAACMDQNRDFDQISRSKKFYVDVIIGVGGV